MTKEITDFIQDYYKHIDADFDLLISVSESDPKKNQIVVAVTKDSQTGRFIGRNGHKVSELKDRISEQFGEYIDIKVKGVKK